MAQYFLYEWTKGVIAGTWKDMSGSLSELKGKATDAEGMYWVITNGEHGPVMAQSMRYAKTAFTCDRR